MRLHVEVTRSDPREVVHGLLPETQAPVVIQCAAARYCVVKDFRDRLPDADVFENIERSVVDPLNVAFAQRPILSTAQSRPDCFDR